MHNQSRRMSFDDDLQVLLQACGVPRRRAPRLADRLADVEQHRVASGAGTLAAWRLGTGPAVLLVHGWEDDHTLWSPLIDVLAQRGRALVAFDMVAHGFSDGEWGLHPEAIDGLHAVARALGPVDAVVAHSSGAGTAALALHEGLPARRSVFVAPPLRGGSRYARYADRLGFAPEVAAAAHAHEEERLGPARAAFRMRDALPTLDTELLLVHSVDDERMPFGDSEGVARQCPRATLLRVEGAKHRRTAREPDVVAAVAGWVT